MLETMVLVNVAPASVEYSRVIGLALSSASVIPALFQVMFCEVPTVHISTPLGEVMVLEGTDGGALSKVKKHVSGDSCTKLTLSVASDRIV